MTLVALEIIFLLQPGLEV